MPQSTKCFFQAFFQLQVGKHQLGKKVSAEGHLLWWTLLIGEVIYRWNDFCIFRSQKGGVAATFDEIPFVKLFLAKYCFKYTAVQPRFKFDGFGLVISLTYKCVQIVFVSVSYFFEFQVFPKHSPLVSNVSMQILNVTEGNQMEKIVQAWLGHKSSCPELSNLVSLDSIGLNSFWGLFLIAGVASSAAFILCMATFVYENRVALVHLYPPASVWRKIKALATALITRTSISILSKKAKRQTQVASMAWMQWLPHQPLTASRVHHAF